MSFDYVIVGSGPIGLATAMYAARQNHRVLVLDRCHGPIDKACGEGLMPPCITRMKSLGVEIPESGSAPFYGIRYIDTENNAIAEADFIEGPGLGVRRLVLSEALKTRARSMGVEIEEGVEALEFTQTNDNVALMTTRGARTGRYLIAADGLHSQIRKQAGFTVTTGPRRRLGIRRHFTTPAWSRHVEVWWKSGVEAYVTPTGPNRVGVAFLWSGGKGNYEHFLEQFPALTAHLGEPESPIRGAGPFDIRVDTRARGRVFLVGDAAGYLDALTGEGIALGMEGAELLVDATTRYKTTEAVKIYEKTWNQATWRHMFLTRSLLWLTRYPWLRRRLTRALARNPSAFQSFLALNSGAITWTKALPSATHIGLGLLG